MKSWTNSTTFIKAINQLSIEDYAASVSGPTSSAMPEHLRDWLGRIRLLYGLPFDYLIPDERLLPNESIRFFYIDRNWTDRLVDGALSVGKTTSREFAHHHAVFNKVRATLDSEERAIRSRLRNDSPKKNSGNTADMTGFLFRSQAVANWPGLEVKAYRGETPSPDSALRLLRMDRLGPDILLCLFDGIPDIVDIEEPREGIQFGIDAPNLNENGLILGDNECPSGFKLKLRHMEGEHAGYEVGWKENNIAIDNIENNYDVNVPVRKADPQVLHIAALKDAIADTLATIKADNGSNFSYDGTLETAGFSVQMLQFPYQQRFQGAGKQAPLDNMPIFDLSSIYQGSTIGITTIIGQLSEKETLQLTEEVFNPTILGSTHNDA
ncbi:MAG: hypothetical protein COA99_02985 [Moraxellaceae bacterium]|nr:MAG: hypothetical protein COA99_02985 [Moraxellaceae bacterium]